MITLYNQYKTSKIKAVAFMKAGQITSYLKALNEANKYKKLLVSVASN